MKRLHFVGGAILVAGIAFDFGGGLHIAPILAQRLDDGGDHQPLDIGARRVVRAQALSLRRIERLFEQGAEDRRLDLVPVL